MRLEDQHIILSQDAREKVLGQVCVEMGYCLPPEPYDQLLDDPPTQVSEFVDAIIRGEGLDPELTTLRTKRRMRDIILEAHSCDDEGAA